MIIKKSIYHTTASGWIKDGAKKCKCRRAKKKLHRAEITLYTVLIINLYKDFLWRFGIVIYIYRYNMSQLQGLSPPSSGGWLGQWMECVCDTMYGEIPSTINSSKPRLHTEGTSDWEKLVHGLIIYVFKHKDFVHIKKRMSPFFFSCIKKKKSVKNSNNTKEVHQSTTWFLWL